MSKDIIKEILERESKGLNIDGTKRHRLIFTYDDAEGMLRELESKLKVKKK